MRKDHKSMIIKRSTSFVFLAISCILTAPLIANAAGYGLSETAEKAGGGENPFVQNDPSTLIGSIIGAALSFIGLLFFILMIYGGITWMTAAGNQQQIDKAKSMITSAVIGLIIVMAAYAITSFIGSTLT